MCSGLATGIYSTSFADACWYVAHSARCNVIVVDSDKQLQKILDVWDRLPQLRAIVQYREPLQRRHDNVYTVGYYVEMCVWNISFEILNCFVLF